MNQVIYKIPLQTQQKLNRLTNIANLPPPFVSPTIHKSLIYKKRPNTGRCLMAVKKINKGEVLMDNNGSLISKPIKYSIQVDKSIHMIGPGGFDHICHNPTAVINPKTHQLIAARDIKPGEYVAFNYLTTEWDMKNPFYCQCGLQNCYKYVRGFKYLTKNQKKELLLELPATEYIKSKSR